MHFVFLLDPLIMLSVLALSSNLVERWSKLMVLQSRRWEHEVCVRADAATRGTPSNE